MKRRALPFAETLTARTFERKLAELKQLVRPSEATVRHREKLTEREVFADGNYSAGIFPDTRLLSAMTPPDRTSAGGAGPPDPRIRGARTALHRPQRGAQRVQRSCLSRSGSTRGTRWTVTGTR